MKAELQYDGDMLKSATFERGYQERPLWAKLQTLTPPEMILWIDRFDSLSAFSCEWALAQAFESAYGLEVPQRTQYVRSVFCEVSRLIWLTTYLGRVMKALDGFTLYQEVMVLREQTFAIQEEITGGRILPQILNLGGCRRDLVVGTIQKLSHFISDWREAWKNWLGLINGDTLLDARLKGLVPISPKVVNKLGWWGIVGKASGVNYDSRFVRPHGAYPFVEIQRVERTEGDAKARFDTVIDEVNLSLEILIQLLSKIPEGSVATPTPKNLKPGIYTATSESGKGPIISCLEITEECQVGSVRLFSTSQRVWPHLDSLFTRIRAEDFQLAYATLGIDSEDGEI